MTRNNEKQVVQGRIQDFDAVSLSVLSHSKHLMNRVICLAEQNDIHIFYQDTDSMHLFESDVHLIGKLFKERYGQELIGESMTQFHNDFDGFNGSVGKIHSRKLIALGKKSYLSSIRQGVLP